MRTLPDVKHFDPSTVVDTVQTLLWEKGWSNTGIQDIVEAAGVSRSSLYATFGSKQELCLAGLKRYIDEQAVPALDTLETSGQGLPAIAGFFGRLITARCAGPRARWGCLLTTLQATAQGTEAGIGEALTAHNERLVTALRTALGSAADLGQLRMDVEPDSAAEHLALLAHGVNVRSKAGAEAETLREAVAGALGSLRRPGQTADTWPHETP